LHVGKLRQAHLGFAQPLALQPHYRYPHLGIALDQLLDILRF
jgi:hypothetical protein